MPTPDQHQTKNGSRFFFLSRCGTWCRKHETSVRPPISLPPAGFPFPRIIQSPNKETVIKSPFVTWHPFPQEERAGQHCRAHRVTPVTKRGKKKSRHRIFPDALWWGCPLARQWLCGVSHEIAGRTGHLSIHFFCPLFFARKYIEQSTDHRPVSRSARSLTAQGPEDTTARRVSLQRGRG